MSHPGVAALKPGLQAPDAPLPLSGGQGVAYGALGLPLAFVALPLTVHLPEHYARELGVPLATVGALLLAVRATDAVSDPWLGRWADHLLRQAKPLRLSLVLLLAAALLAFSLWGLFSPPAVLLAASAQGDTAGLLGWAAGLLLVAYLAYSFLTVLHQAWGTGLGASEPAQARVVAWREGAALLGVVVASILPSVWGVGALGPVVAVLLLLALGGLWWAPRPQAVPLLRQPRALWSPWRDARFRRLLLVYLVNGVASAIPATLLLFYLRDRLQAPEAQAMSLALYFCAAALSLPLWVKLVSRIGLAQGWLLGMGLAIVAFIGASVLGPGDVALFGLICVASGLALGADITAAPALLARLKGEAATEAEDAGLRFGWWNLVTKLNLALAAGVALPLLQWWGYQPGVVSAQGATALALMYGLLPCLLKACAAGLLYLLWIRKE